jgi:GDP-L-fucose synthase
MIEKNSKIFVAGHNGLVGSAIVRKLQKKGFTNLILKSRSELDLTNQIDVDNFFKNNNIEYVFLAAAKVGGIIANNTYRADFIYQNLMIECNIIHSSYKYGVKKLLFLGSNCMYPKFSKIPISETELLTGPLEPTNQPYAIAKISGIELCKAYRDQYGCNFISVMPTNLYGPNDNYDLQNSHVLPALIRKFMEAKKENSPSVVLWGTGNPRREFLHSDDLAEACILLMNIYNEKEIVNLGFGSDITIKELANIIKSIIKYEGQIFFDTTKPDGTFQKLLDSSKAFNLGWKPLITLEEGIKIVYDEIYHKF